MSSREMAYILRAIQEKKLGTVRIDSLTDGRFACWIDCVIEGRGNTVFEAISAAAKQVPVHIAYHEFTRPL